MELTVVGEQRARCDLKLQSRSPFTELLALHPGMPEPDSSPSDDPWTAWPMLARFGVLTFPLWHRQDAALDTTPGEHPRIMIDGAAHLSRSVVQQAGFRLPCAAPPAGSGVLSAPFQQQTTT